MRTVTRYDFTPGPVDREHPARACDDCLGEGRVEERLPARSHDLEERWTSFECPDCEGKGRVPDEIECNECGAELDYEVGVGAVVEVKRTSAGPTYAFGSHDFYALCGPCAWSEVVDD